MASDGADLVVVGAGTIGGWASYFAATQGAKRVVVVVKPDAVVSWDHSKLAGVY